MLPAAAWCRRRRRVFHRGATVTVHPFVEGRGLDRGNPAEVRAAGATLGLLHGAVAGAPSDRPEPSPWDARFWPGDHDPPTLRDAQLDAWHEAFTHGGDGAFAHRVIHGDFWADNIVWSAGRVAAVIDWSEARVDVLAREPRGPTVQCGSASRSADRQEAAPVGLLVAFLISLVYKSRRQKPGPSSAVIGSVPPRHPAATSTG